MKTVAQGLSKEYMARLEAYTMQVQQRLSAGGYAGVRKSTAKGNSLEFSDFRDYIPGDDLRRIDWNSAARFDKLYLKLFMEEKQVNIHLVLDASASMAAETEKGFSCGMLAASVAYIGLKNMDRVSVFGINGSGISEKTGLSSRQSLLEAVQFLDGLSYEGETMLSASLKKLAPRLSKGGVTLVFSDCFSADGFEDGLKALQQRGQEVFLIQMLAAEEKRPTLAGPLRLIDAETGLGLDMEITPEVLADYEKNRQTFENEIAAFCNRRGIRFLPFTADMPLLQCLNKMMQ